MDTLLPAAVLIGVGALIAVARSRSALARLTAEGGAFLAIAWLLVERGTSPLPFWRTAAQPDTVWLRALAIAWWLIGARLAVTLGALVMRGDARLRQARLFSDVLAILIYASVALVIADSVLDLQLRGLIATSGIIAVVLGFALQNTLSDLFSGIAVGVEHPFAVGDRISVDADISGTVVQTNWRSVWVQTEQGDVAAVPNAMIARSLLINHSRPTAMRGGSVKIEVRSTWATGRLMDLLGQALLLCPDILASPAPTITVKRVGRHRITFKIAFHVAESGVLIRARSDLLRQARRFLQHGGADADQPVDDRPLADVGLFHMLPLERVTALRDACEPRHLAPGMDLIVAGIVVDSLSIVTAGVLDVVIGSEGRSIGRVGPGEYLGEVSMMTGEPSPVTVRALTSVDVLALPKGDLVRLVDGEPDVVAALREAVQQGITVVERDKAAQQGHPVPDQRTFLRKVAEFLSRPVAER